EEATLEERGAHPVGSSSADLRLALADSHPGVRAKAVEDLAARGVKDALPDIVKCLEDESTAVRENAAKALGGLGDASATAALEKAMMRDGEDEWVTLRAAESVARLGDARGIPVLIRIVQSGDAKLARQDALGALLSVSGLDGGKPGDPSAAETQNLLRALDRWWQQHHDDLRWDASKKRFNPPATAS